MVLYCTHEYHHSLINNTFSSKYTINNEKCKEWSPTQVKITTVIHSPTQTYTFTSLDIFYVQKIIVSTLFLSNIRLQHSDIKLLWLGTEFKLFQIIPSCTTAVPLIRACCGWCRNLLKTCLKNGMSLDHTI